jgi:methyl-accepting chemotaxis protein
MSKNKVDSAKKIMEVIKSKSSKAVGNLKNVDMTAFMNKIKTIKGKMIVFTVSLLAITIIINMCVSIFMSRKGLLENVETDIISMGEMVSEDLSSKLELEAIKAKHLGKSKSLTIAYFEPEMKYKLINDEKEQFNLESIGLITSKNELVTDSKDLSMNMIDEKLLDIARKEGFSFSRPIESTNSGLISMAFASNEQGDVIVSILDGDFYSNMVSEFEIGKSGNVFILDENGTMIGNKNPDLVRSKSNFIKRAETDSSHKTAASVFKKMISGESGVGKYTYKGADQFCYYAPISGSNGWSFGVVAPVKEMTSSLMMTGISITIASLILLIVGILVAIGFAIKISNPVIAMNKRMELLAKGDLHTPLEIEVSNDEIGQMAESMKKTIAGLNDYIKDLEQGLEKIADGNLDAKFEADYLGDFINLEQALTTTVLKLNETMQQVLQSSEQVAIGADQVSSSSQVLAQGSAEQASSVEELTASIAEISKYIQDNAENATAANDKAHKVGDELARSNEQMESMLYAMKEIKQASEKIGKIIKTIDSIAFQTNILALNAAIEAARAGEAGKGFAVVADEVRNLASKSAEAANETTVLIEGSILAVQKGSKIANTTAKSLKVVVGDAGEIVTMMDKISSVSQKQSDDIGEISQGIDQISSVIQTNSATAEESAAASEELSGQAQVMEELMKQFNLIEEEKTFTYQKQPTVPFRQENLEQDYTEPHNVYDNSKY